MSTQQHEDYMRRCIDLAEEAGRRGDAPFGSVIVCDGQVVAEGSNHVRTRLDVAAHGEIDAIRNACQALGTLDLSGCTLYTNAEPCFMCSYAIRETGIRQVVIGVRGLERGGTSSRYPILADPNISGWPPPPRIVHEVLLDECSALLQSWQAEPRR